MSKVDLNTQNTQSAIDGRPNANSAGEIAVSRSVGGVAIQNGQQAMELAKMMAVSNQAVPAHLRNNPGACLGVVFFAAQWDMHPYAVASKTYVVNDRIAFESQMVQAVILRRAPITGRIRFELEGSGPTRRCRAWTVLAEDGSTVDYTSPEIKDIKVQNSPLWKSDPDQQLCYYSGRALCRRYFPDVLNGVYTPDEVAEASADQTIHVSAAPTHGAGLGDRLSAMTEQADDYAEFNDVPVAEPERKTDAPPMGLPDDLMEKLYLAATNGPISLKLALGKLTVDQMAVLDSNPDLRASLNNMAREASHQEGRE